MIISENDRSTWRQTCEFLLFLHFQSNHSTFTQQPFPRVPELREIDSSFHNNPTFGSFIEARARTKCKVQSCTDSAIYFYSDRYNAAVISQKLKCLSYRLQRHRPDLFLARN
ncbi:hypothetical protein Zmor_002504 [Zophobas morio]|uniref:Uncharacterized protein n=1 Tax=Zophobas morio TaxID=2755281 RepID=A0AA38J0V4_9CUCU|nr:hypothetical protein Zmor_002504 [Zophobas morio]